MVGSQNFQFNRLLRQLDFLVKNKKFKDCIFAQTGYSDYKPTYYDYNKFINQKDMKNYIKRSSLVICHGGTGAIVSALKENKKVIVVPRRSEYGEHVDNHQFEIVKRFEKLGFIEPCYDEKMLYKVYLKIKKNKYNKYVSNTQKYEKTLNDFLDGLI